MMPQRRVPMLGSFLWLSFNLALFARAQTSNVTCIASYNWADNSLKQTPCLVAAYLGDVCSSEFGEPSEIVPLPKGDHYLGPTVTQVDYYGECLCSTPYYMLISACAACQNETWLGWGIYNTNCSSFLTPPLGTFPLAIPDETVVPNWAYLLPTDTDGTFNPVNAKAAGDAPESSGYNIGLESSYLNELSSLLDSTLTNSVSFTLPGLGSTTAAAGPPSTPGLVFPTPTQIPTTLPGSGNKKSNTRAIIGGSVAGVVVLLAAIGVIWGLKRKSGRHNVPPPTIGGGKGSLGIVGGGAGAATYTPGEYEEDKAAPETSQLPQSISYLPPPGAQQPLGGVGAGTLPTGYSPTQFHPNANIPSLPSPVSVPVTGYQPTSYQPTSYHPTNYSGGAITPQQPTANFINTGYGGTQPEILAPPNRGFSGAPEL